MHQKFRIFKLKETYIILQSPKLWGGLNPGESLTVTISIDLLIYRSFLIDKSLVDLSTMVLLELKSNEHPSKHPLCASNSPFPATQLPMTAGNDQDPYLFH